MKGIRFFLEYPNKTEKNKATVKNLGAHLGNVIAVLLGKEHTNPDGCQECISALYFHPNSDTCLGAVDKQYLRERCKRIPERLVKDIHPNLWERLIN
jgi:hypothetical protein